ncbi:hypothetical protein ACHQM5_016659 [Ranunculus cassubicifolius]
MKSYEELGQSILIALIFSFLVAKLISILLQFKHQNLKLIRDSIESESESDENKRFIETDLEEEWGEGVENSELDEDFTSATAFIATSAAASYDEFSKKVSKEAQLELYGLYKVATQGICDIPRPSALQLSKRSKWNAWQRLGSMSAQEAMQNYIILVTELYPFWATRLTSENKEGDNDGLNSVAKRTMGPVFSTFIHEDFDDEV